MGKGRAPCCDKSKVKRGPWNPAEDLRLITFIQKHGHENWRALPKQAGLQRCGKSCRLRWINYLRPDVKRGNFTQEEEETVIRLHETLGNKWSKIASYLPGRTDNEIKNVWNTHLKKKLAFGESSFTSSSSSSSSTNIVSSGKRNADAELDEDHNYVPKKPRESEDDVALSQKLMQNSEGEKSNSTDVASKEMKIIKEFSSSSCSSDNSLVLNSCQVDATRPEEQMGSSNFEFGENFHFGVNMNGLEEVNKPEIFSENGMEIPLESDFDFWNMLDNLESFQSNVEVEASQSSSFAEAAAGDKNKEVESRKWFEYLENELGLEATVNENKEKSEIVVAETAEAVIPETYEILLKPEVDPGITYFQLWNSSAESSVF